MMPTLYQHKTTLILFILLIMSTAITANNVNPSGCCLLSQSFNFQAEVILDGSPANGQFDVIFYLYNDEFPSGGMNGSPVGFDSQTITIEDGLINTALDFGQDAFSTEQIWLEIVLVDPFGQGDVVLEPRTPINAVPIALVAQSVMYNGIDASALQNSSVTSSKIASQAVTNFNIKDHDITFDKLAANGASNGDIIQFNGSDWVSTSAGTSQWSDTSDGISYNSGKVSIGTDVPTGLFHMHGDGSDELSLYGVNSTPFIHFRRLNGNVDWVLKQSDNGTRFHIQTEVSDNTEVLSLTSSGQLGINTASPNGVFDLRDNSGDLLFNVNTDGQIDRKPQTRELYLSYQSFNPKNSDDSYDTINYLGINGYRSTHGSSVLFHIGVNLPESAVVTKFEVIAGDNSSDGGITANFGYRTFGTNNGIINLATLSSNNSPFGEVLLDNLSHTTFANRNYFIDIEIDDAQVNGQENIFAGARITYEVSSL